MTAKTVNTDRVIENKTGRFFKFFIKGNLGKTVAKSLRLDEWAGQNNKQQCLSPKLCNKFHIEASGIYKAETRQ
jgi:hypothetical protein